MLTDCRNAWHARTFCLHVHETLSPTFLLSLSLPPSLFISLSLTSELGAHTLFTSQREREREREKESENEGERERERKRVRMREREICRKWLSKQNCYFYF
jgi:hypothetical protein